MKLIINESDDKITAKSFQELISKLEDHGYSCEHYYDTKYPESNWLYITKNSDPYEAEFYKYRDGEYELYLHNIHPTKREDESVTRSKRNKLVEKSNFDTVDKAIRYYYPKWYYDDMSVNDIFDSLEKLGHSQDFIDAVIDGITAKYENEEDYGLDDYDECLTTEDLCLEGRYGTLADYLENHLDSWYGRLNEIGEDIEELGLDVDEINGEYIIVHASEPDGEDVYCKIRLGGTERTISLETFEMLESVRRSKNALIKAESVSLKERELVDDKYVLSSKESRNMEDDLRGIYVDDSLDILEDELSAEGFEYYDEGPCIVPKDCGYRIWVNGTFKITIYYGLDDNIVSDIYVNESIK